MLREKEIFHHFCQDKKTSVIKYYDASSYHQKCLESCFDKKFTFSAESIVCKIDWSQSKQMRAGILIENVTIEMFNVSNGNV